MAEEGWETKVSKKHKRNNSRFSADSERARVDGVYFWASDTSAGKNHPAVHSPGGTRYTEDDEHEHSSESPKSPERRARMARRGVELHRRKDSQELFGPDSQHTFYAQEQVRKFSEDAEETDNSQAKRFAAWMKTSFSRGSS